MTALLVTPNRDAQPARFLIGWRMLTTKPLRWPDGMVYDDDYLVLSDGREVGRIVKQLGVPMGGPNWYWGIVLPGQAQPSDWRGMSDSIDNAKAAFKNPLGEDQ